MASSGLAAETRGQDRRELQKIKGRAGEVRLQSRSALYAKALRKRVWPGMGTHIFIPRTGEVGTDKQISLSLRPAGLHVLQAT